MLWASMAIQGYRAYLIGPDDHITKCVEVRTDDEAVALRLAASLADRATVELWQGARKIARFEPKAARPSTH